jgi:hypothetical protein
MTRIVTALAGALALFPLSPRPAAADNPETPLRVYFTRLHCLDESDDWGNSDEPYVVVFAADLRGSQPKAIVRRSQIFEDVDTGDTRTGNLQFWALDGSGDPITSQEDYLFLVALLESDDAWNTVTVQQQIQATLIPRLINYRAIGLSRSAIASQLRADMDFVLRASKGSDEQYGQTREVLFFTSDLRRAREGNAVDRTYTFTGSDCRYTLTFRLQ